MPNGRTEKRHDRRPGTEGTETIEDVVPRAATAKSVYRAPHGREKSCRRSQDARDMGTSGKGCIWAEPHQQAVQRISPIARAGRSASGSRTGRPTDGETSNPQD